MKTLLSLKNIFFNKKKEQNSLEKCRRFKSVAHLHSDASLLSYSTTTTTHSSEEPNYSNFYMKLPNGNWMVRYRTRDRKIVDSYEINGHLI